VVKCAGDKQDCAGMCRTVQNIQDCAEICRTVKECAGICTMKICMICSVHQTFPKDIIKEY
jgi:hypothetical protein